MVMENILEKIKDIRKQKGFSHKCMAHKLEILLVLFL